MVFNIFWLFVFRFGMDNICYTAAGFIRQLDALGRTQVQKLRSMGLRQRDVQDVLNEAWFFTRWLWREFLVGMPVKLLLFLAFRGHRLVDIASKS